MEKIKVPCPVCHGTKDASVDDGHRRNRKDDCETCGNTGMIDAATGTSPQASYNPETGTTFDVYLVPQSGQDTDA